MQDFVPLGTGNSRSLKSSISAGTTWEQALEMLRNGTFPIDIGAVNDAGVSQKGTPINMASLLTLAVAAKYGKGVEAVPSEIFDILSKAALVGDDGSLSTPGGQGLSQVKVVAGTYTGDGKAKKSLTFNGEVQLIVVNGESNYGKPTMVAPKGSQECHMAGPSTNMYVNARITWSGNTVSFSNGTLATSNAYMNVSGQTYYYLAILL